MRIGSYSLRAFVVTVPEMQERTDLIQSHFKSVGIEAEEFAGFNGVVSGLVTTHTYEYDNPGTNYRIGTKPVASWISFYSLWSALNLLPDTHFLTCEWDSKFPANWMERAEAALRDVPPDFDLLFLGSCCTGGKPITHVKGEVFDVRYPLCGHATIVAKKALPIMLKTQRKIYAPIDISLAFHTFHLLKVYTVLPSLVMQFDTDLPV